MGLKDMARQAVASKRAGLKGAAKGVEGASGFAKRVKKNPKKISPAYNAFNSLGG